MASSTSKEHLQTAKSPVISSTEEVVSRPVTAAPESGADAGNPTSPLTEEKPRQVEDAQAAKTAKGNAGQVTSPVLTTSRGAGRKGHRQKARAQMGLQAVAPLSQPVTAEAAASGPVAAEKVTAQPDTAEPVQAQPQPAAEIAMPASAVANENLRQAEDTFAVDMVSWYPVMSGLMLQFLLGLCVLRWSTGRDALRCLSTKMENFLGYTTHGSFFVFGHLASGWNLTEALGDLASLMPRRDLEAHEARDIRPLLPVFVFQVLPVIFFFSLFVNILYFYGIMQWVVVRLGGFLQFTMGTTVCESTTAAANIFLGQ
ncbi:hypothetical protein V5799_010076, partial [Amblyomma americanum]